MFSPRFFFPEEKSFSLFLPSFTRNTHVVGPANFVNLGVRLDLALKVNVF